MSSLREVALALERAKDGRFTPLVDRMPMRRPILAKRRRVAVVNGLTDESRGPFAALRQALHRATKSY